MKIFNNLKIKKIKEELKRTDDIKRTARGVEDIYKFMIDSIPSDTTHLINKNTIEWLNNRQTLRQKLHEAMGKK